MSESMKQSKYMRPEGHIIVDDREYIVVKVNAADIEVIDIHTDETVIIPYVTVNMWGAGCLV